MIDNNICLWLPYNSSYELYGILNGGCVLY